MITYYNFRKLAEVGGNVVWKLNRMVLSDIDRFMLSELGIKWVMMLDCERDVVEGRDEQSFEEIKDYITEIIAN